MLKGNFKALPALAFEEATTVDGAKFVIIHILLYAYIQILQTMSVTHTH